MALAAVFLTAFYYSLNYWGLMGMEVSAMTLVITVSVWGALNCTGRGEIPLWLPLLLGIATVIRPDAAVFSVSIIAFLSMGDARSRKRIVLLGVASLVFFLGLQTMLRLYYYGDLLPNTYYLKMTGYPVLPRVIRGAFELLQFVWESNWVLFVGPALLPLFRRDRPVLLLLWVVVWQAGYSVFAGGDAWEHWISANRYLAPVMPLFFVLLSYCLHQGLLHAVDVGVFRPRAGKLLIPFGMGLLSLGVLMSVNSSREPSGIVDWLLVKSPYSVEENRQHVELALALARVTDPGARVAVVRAGVTPYFCDRPMVDLLGKTDRRVARLEARVQPGLQGLVAYYPGHLKWDYAYSLGELKPDVVAELWWAPEKAAAYLRGAYREVALGDFLVHVRVDSEGFPSRGNPSSPAL